MPLTSLIENFVENILFELNLSFRAFLLIRNNTLQIGIGIPIYRINVETIGCLIPRAMLNRNSELITNNNMLRQQ